MAILVNKQEKPVSASAIENHKMTNVLDSLSPQGLFFGSKLLQMVEEIAKTVAEKHTEAFCQALAIDYVRFFSPAKINDTLFCSASVNHTWNSFLEVGIKVTAEDFRTLETKKVLSAYFTFQAIDSNKESIEVSAIIPETEEQTIRFKEAQIRRKRLKEL
jgi:acyl-CoA hydrolase